MADLREFYRIHISQLSSLGMPLVEDFRLGFYSFRLRDNAPKIISVPPKGFTVWKSKFFYVKEATVVYKLLFRNVTENIPKEKITVPEVGVQDWAATLQAIPLVTLANKELQYLRMMMRNKSGVKKKLVVKEHEKVVQLWRTFVDDFEGKIAVEEFGEGEEGWYEATIAGFHVPNPTALDAPLPKGRSNVASGTFRPRIRKYEDYIILSNTIEGFGIPGSSSGAGGTSAGIWPIFGQKRKYDITLAGAVKRVSLRRARTATPSTRMPAVFVGKFLRT
ncbi:hypothetical protein Hanom_Chr10g00949671 [Helianthus anomalus]